MADGGGGGVLLLRTGDLGFFRWGDLGFGSEETQKGVDANAVIAAGMEMTRGVGFQIKRLR